MVMNSLLGVLLEDKMAGCITNGFGIYQEAVSKTPYPTHLFRPRVALRHDHF